MSCPVCGDYAMCADCVRRRQTRERARRYRERQRRQEYPVRGTLMDEATGCLNDETATHTPTHKEANDGLQP